MIHLYQTSSSYPKVNAQNNLLGRTHYVDDATLKGFRARILSSHVLDQGLLFAIVESCSGDYEHNTRIYRHVIFDIFGTVLDRPKTEEAYKSRAAATKAMWRAVDKLDAKAITMDAIARKMREAINSCEDLIARMGKLDLSVRTDA